MIRIINVFTILFFIINIYPAKCFAWQANKGELPGTHEALSREDRGRCCFIDLMFLFSFFLTYLRIE